MPPPSKVIKQEVVVAQARNPTAQYGDLYQACFKVSSTCINQPSFSDKASYSTYQRATHL